MLIRVLLNHDEPAQSPASPKDAFETFARRKGHRVSTYYNEQPPAPGRANLFQLLRDRGVAIASQGRPAAGPQKGFRDELFRLIKEARPGDVLLVERAETLRQIVENDWQHVRRKVKERKLRVVSLDVEASWVMVTGESAMAAITEMLTGMMLDMLQVQNRPHEKDQRQRHLEGIARAKAQGKYKGRPVDHEKHEQILALLESGHSWSEVCKETGASRSTIARVTKSDA